MSKIMALNGPNLNLLGTREPELYGSATLETINHEVRGLVEAEGHEFVAFQSNAEHELVAVSYTHLTLPTNREV